MRPGSISGPWTANSGNETFSGNRLGGNATARYLFSVTFTSDLYGVLTFDIGDDGQVSGVAYSLENNQQSTASGTPPHVTTSDGAVAEAAFDIETDNSLMGLGKFLALFFQEHLKEMVARSAERSFND